MKKHFCVLLFVATLISACKKGGSSDSTTQNTTTTTTNTQGTTAKITVTTLAGTAGSFNQGNTNGTGPAASFDSPRGMATDAVGNIYVTDYGNGLIRKISPAGVVTTFASASYQLAGITVDAAGYVYVTVVYPNYIYKLSPGSVYSAIAGAPGGPSGNINGPGSSATFNGPAGVAVDAAGNLYVADTGNGLIRKITSAGVVTTLAGNGNLLSSTDGVGTAASFFYPQSVAVDPSGNVYVADHTSIRKISPAGVVTTLAGSNTAGATNGTGASATFNEPYGVALDAAGNLYVADTYNNLIRKITAAGVVTTLAGSGVAGGADGAGSVASFNHPFGITVDAGGNIYVADTNNNIIRKITVQ